MITEQLKLVEKLIANKIFWCKSTLEFLNKNKFKNMVALTNHIPLIEVEYSREYKSYKIKTPLGFFFGENQKDFYRFLELKIVIFNTMIKIINKSNPEELESWEILNNKHQYLINHIIPIVYEKK